MITSSQHDSEHRKLTIIYAPGLRQMAEGIASCHGGAHAILCASDMAGDRKPSVEDGVCWDLFPSADPNLKLRVDAVAGRHVVFLMSHNTDRLFEQLALIQFLQRFNLPRPLPEYAAGKWKRSVADGEYDECGVASLTLVLPWYRFCQMERTSRWTVRDGSWYNGKPDGEFVDVPTALSFASLVSARPFGGTRPLPPQQLLLIDIHEYNDLERTFTASKAWANASQPYDFTHGTGTYFASAFRHFLSHVLLPSLTTVATGYVVFPDFGAHRRFSTMVQRCLPGISHQNILWISKSRVGASISQEDGFHYTDAAGTPQKLVGNFPPGARVLIADDFTNSGSTLFGGAKIIRAHGDASLHVSAYVTHFVAKYSPAAVEGFLARLYDTGAALDAFHCTDSVADIVSVLRTKNEERLAAGAANKLHVMPLAALLADWITAHPLPARGGGNGSGGVCAATLSRAAERHGVALAIAVGIGFVVGWTMAAFAST